MQSAGIDEMLHKGELRGLDRQFVTHARRDLPLDDRSLEDHLILQATFVQGHGDLGLAAPALLRARLGQVHQQLDAGKGTWPEVAAGIGDLPPGAAPLPGAARGVGSVQLTRGAASGGTGRPPRRGSLASPAVLPH